MTNQNIVYIQYLTTQFLELQKENQKLKKIISDLNIPNDIVEEINEQIVDEIDDEQTLMDKLYTNKGTKWKEASLKTLRSNLYHMSEHIFNKPKCFEIEDFIKSPDKVINYLENVYEGKSAKNYCQSVIDILKHNDLPYEEYKTYKEKFGKKYIQSDRPHGWTWDRVIDEYNTLSKKENKTVKEYKMYVILALYIELPPQRQQVYLDMEFKDDGENNYMDIQEGKMVLRDFKTANLYGETEYKLNDKLKAILAQWMNDYAWNKNYLFVTQSGTPPETSTFTDFMRNNFGITTNQLRKLYVSDVVVYLSADEKTRIARQMLHSVSMQALTYTQYS